MQGLFVSHRRLALILGVLVLLLASCRHTPSVSKETSVSSADTVALGENLFRYARNVTAYPTEYGYRMEVLNPWDSTQKLGQFALLKEGVPAANCPAGWEPVSIPAQSFVSFSSTHCHLHC